MRREICIKFYNNQKRVDFSQEKIISFLQDFSRYFKENFSQLYNQHYNVIYIQDHSRLSFDKLACEIANLLHKFRIVYRNINIITSIVPANSPSWFKSTCNITLARSHVVIFGDWMATLCSPHLSLRAREAGGMGGKGQRSILKLYSADTGHDPFEKS